MALTDVEHVEAVSIIRRLVERPTDPEGVAAAEGWLEAHHPDPSAYVAAARSLSAEVEDELDAEAGKNGGQG